MHVEGHKSHRNLLNNNDSFPFLEKVLSKCPAKCNLRYFFCERMLCDELKLIVFLVF